MDQIERISEIHRAISAQTEQMNRVEGALETLLKELQAPDVPSGVNIAAGVALEALEGKPAGPCPSPEVAYYAEGWDTKLGELRLKVADLQQVNELKAELLLRIGVQLQLEADRITEQYPATAHRLRELAREASDA